jgi:methylglutaconyl-CoA hydratase
VEPARFVPETVLGVAKERGRARVTLQRPNARNAFNAELIARLAAAFSELGADPAVRVIVLEGAGPAFCGGADVHWMSGSLELSEADNLRDAEAMSDMFRAIDRCPKPVIGRVHGAALGGGAGLCAVCDAVVAAETAFFGFTETKLGLIPAVISPFAIAKIGVTHARRLFLTGERFDAQRARAIGLVHDVVPEANLDGAVDAIAHELEGAGPEAVAAAKRLIREVAATSYDATRGLTAAAIAGRRVSPEGQEGLRAFLERRPAAWISE